LDSGRAGLGGGEVVASRFEALTPKAQAVAAPVEDLDTVCLAVAEDEQVARQRVGLQAVDDAGGQAGGATRQVHGVGAIPRRDGGRQAQHGASLKAATRERTKARSQPGASRRAQPLGRTSSTGAASKRWTDNRRGCSPPGAGAWGWSLFFQ